MRTLNLADMLADILRPVYTIGAIHTAIFNNQDLLLQIDLGL